MTYLITAGALLVLALGGGGEVPGVISDDSGPLWVAAEVASAEGRLSVASLGRFGEAVEQKAARAAERMAQSNTPGECSTSSNRRSSPACGSSAAGTCSAPCCRRS